MDSVAMNLTDEQRGFVRQTKLDVYQAMIVKVYADAWAMGYDAARRDVQALGGLDVYHSDHPLYAALAKLHEDSFGDLMGRAQRELVGRNEDAERRALEALAMLGPLNGAPR